MLVKTSLCILVVNLSLKLKCFTDLQTISAFQRPCNIITGLCCVLNHVTLDNISSICGNEHISYICGIIFPIFVVNIFPIFAVS